MAYEKQTWQCGDTVTADKLNHIEDGIAECCGGSALEVTATIQTSDITLDKTWQEINDAFPNVAITLKQGEAVGGKVIPLAVAGGGEYFFVRILDLDSSTGGTISLGTNSADGYPKGVLK